MFSNVRTLTKTIAGMIQKTTPPVKTYSHFKTFTAKDVLSSDEISVYKRLFVQMDSNNDGFLTKEDLKKGLKEYAKYSATEEELRETMETLDSDKDGTVSFNEFIGYIAWSRQIRTEEAIRYAFQTFEKNGNGFISKNELREALVGLELTANDSLLNNIMRRSDKERDENITLDEFRKAVYSKDITTE